MGLEFENIEDGKFKGQYHVNYKIKGNKSLYSNTKYGPYRRPKQMYRINIKKYIF